VSENKQIILGFLAQGLLIFIVPFFARMGGENGFWLCFATLLVYGVGTGIAQAACYSANARLPLPYI
jgi:hypothetical protein